MAEADVELEDGPGDLNTVLVDITSVIPMPDEENANEGDTASMVESLREFKQHRPVVVQRSTGRAIAGNHMLEAAVILGWTKIWVHYVEDDDVRAVRRAIADNATGRKGKFKMDVLVDQAEAVGFDIPGLDKDAIDKYLKKLSGDTEIKPVFPIVPQFNETFDYVVVVAFTDTDSTFIRTVFPFERQQSPHGPKVGISHIATVADLRKVIENGSPQGVPDDGPSKPDDDDDGGAEPDPVST